MVIHKRKIYGVLDFLADSGGVYGSLFLLGSILHFIVTQDILSIKLLEGHFKVAMGKLNPDVLGLQQDKNFSDSNSLKSRRSEKLGCCEHMIFGSCLRILLRIFKPPRYCSKRQEKFQLLEQARRASDRALDLRTILKTQSVVLSLAQTVLTSPELIRHAKLQKFGKVLIVTNCEERLDKQNNRQNSEKEFTGDQHDQGLNERLKKDADYFAKVLFETSDEDLHENLNAEANQSGQELELGDSKSMSLTTLIDADMSVQDYE